MYKRVPIDDVVKYKYPLANIKKIELTYDEKGCCTEELVTILNNPQISGRSFIDDNYSVPQPPTLNRATTNLVWESNSENQSNQQWLANNCWTTTPATVSVGANIAQERKRPNTQKTPYTGCSNRQYFQSENNPNMQNELSSSKK